MIEPPELVEEPSRERLKRPADSVLTGEGQREPGGQEGGEEGGVHGVRGLEEWPGRSIGRTWMWIFMGVGAQRCRRWRSGRRLSREARQRREAVSWE